MKLLSNALLFATSGIPVVGFYHWSYASLWRAILRHLHSKAPPTAHNLFREV